MIANTPQEKTPQGSLSNYQFTAEDKAELKKYRDFYPQNRALILPALRLAMKRFGECPTQVVSMISKEIDVPEVWIEECLSFYTLFRRNKAGKFHIQVCGNLTCSMMGAQKVIEYIEKNTGCKVGQTDLEKHFTVEKVECLGSCGTAPMMQVNDQFYESLTFKKIDEILASFKNELREMKV